MNILQGIGRFFGLSTKFTNLFYNNIQVGDKGNIWIETNKPYTLYMEIPQLPIVINRIARMTANGVWKIKDKDGNEITSPEAIAVLELLRKPSFIQTENTYIEAVVKHLTLYGNSFSRKNVASRLQTIPTNLITISPRLLQPNLSGLLYDQTTLEGVVKNYRYQDNSTQKTYEVNEIIWAKLDNADNPIIGTSPIEHLKYPLSNIQESYKYRNAILSKKGALGIISSDAVEMGSSRTMSPQDRQEFENEYFQKYGSGDGQKAFMMSRFPIRFTPTSYPTKEMQLFEEVEVNLATISQLYGLSTNIFDTKTTFENLKNGIIQSYQDCIFPISDIIAQSHKDGLKLPKEWELSLDYSHIELLKESKLRGAQAVNQGLSAISNALANGLIDEQTAQSASESLLSAVI
jgi:hypothetical protein